MASKTYAPVWQTWTLVKEVECAPERAPPAGAARECLRERVQIARIRARLTPAMLAERARCDAATVSAFERGEDVLAPDVEARLLQALGLAPKK